MSDLDLRLQEMIQVRDNMSTTAAQTRERFDAKMRDTVKDLLSYRYALEGEPIEDARKRREFMQHIENAEILSDAIFGKDPSKSRLLMKNYEWNRGRPHRIYDYIQRLADMFPSRYLLYLLRTSLNHTAEETIAIFEADKGEALHSDYSGQQTGLDYTTLPVVSKSVRKMNESNERAHAQ